MTEHDEKALDRESEETEAINENQGLPGETSDTSRIVTARLANEEKVGLELEVDAQRQSLASPGPDTGVTMYRAAGFWIRLCAFIIDLLVIGGLNAIIWELLLPAGPKTGFINEILHVNALFLGVTGALYFILMTHYFQQTLGKMIAGIKVIQRSGEPLSWITVIFRELVARTLSQIMGLNLGYIVCWFNAEKRCVHDLLSDTWVVYEKTQSEPGYIAVKSSRS